VKQRTLDFIFAREDPNAAVASTRHEQKSIRAQSERQAKL
jgi:hypothetical protein